MAGLLEILLFVEKQVVNSDEWFYISLLNSERSILVRHIIYQTRRSVSVL